ncbi:hypothetical protein [Rhizobium sp. G21]|uniref:hypothetical protein n=1 Tax=Rhizobium sp. G21 TaxID=2758439 RepID=UPI0016006390|nr:hypothetical protein [Rhizobium sp. G21]MBB1250187.1 hypothetical protein [Rhizobium sp. G21]
MAIFLTATLAMVPAIVFGALRSGVDSIFHARWQEAFARQFWAGDLYPRWLMDLNDGFGSPAFFLYPPLGHVVTALLHPLFPDPSMIALKLGLSAWLALLASGIACLFWLRRAFPEAPRAALAGAIVYLLAPYHLYIDVYQRGAFAEVWAFVWPPLTLMMLTAPDRLRGRTIAVTALTLAGLFTTHAPSILIAGPAYGLYALILDLKDRRPIRLTTLALSTLLGLLLAGGYLGTALTHSVYIDTAALFSGRNLASNWLLGGAAWPDPGIEFYVHVASALTFGPGLLIATVALARSRTAARIQAVVALAFLLPALVLMSVLSRPIWELHLPLDRVQFPWRFLLLATIGLSLAVTAAAAGARPRLSRVLPFAVIIVGLLVNIGFTLLPERLPASIDPESITRASPGDDSWDAPEYRPASPVEVQGLFAPGERVRLIEGEGKVVVRDWSPRRIRLAFDLKSEGVVAIRQFAYPGWRASAGGLVEGTKVLQIAAPAGRSEVELRLEPLLAERMGWWASLCGLLILAFIRIAPRLMAKRRL